MAGSLQVGDKVQIHFPVAMTDPDTGVDYKGKEGTILAIDQHDTRIEALNGVMERLP